jgi:hypothetical protein
MSNNASVGSDRDRDDDVTTFPNLFVELLSDDGMHRRLTFAEFATGISSIAGRRKYPLSPRPTLIADFVPALKMYLPTLSPKSLQSVKGALTLLWRFFDKNSDLAVQRIADLTDVHGNALVLWLSDNQKDMGTYRLLKTIVGFARAYYSLPECYWPSIHNRDDYAESRDIEPPAILAIYRALIKEAQQYKQVRREGARLAAVGRDPRGTQFAAGGYTASGWEHRENHAWLVEHIAAPMIVEKRDFISQGGSGLNKSNDPTRRHPGPTYLAPGHSPRASEGIVGKLRWFYPSLCDTLLFYNIFLIGTGWNESTALNLDISTPQWASTHHLQPKIKILKAFKPRSRAHQYASSLEHSEWRPYQIICYMLEATAGLRRRLLYDIDKLKAHPQLESDPALRNRLITLLQRSKSPWLFHSLDHIGEVLALTSSFNTCVNASLNDLILRHGIRDSRGHLCKVTSSDWRDAFAANVNESERGIFSASVALGHVSRRIIHRYLNQARLRRRADAHVMTMMRGAFSEIESGRTLDGSTLRVLVQQGTITEEQRKRISDFRNRSRTGFGCLDPMSPPAHIAPDHKAGMLCRVQRCAICPLAVVFDDNTDLALRRYAELIKIQEMVPACTWAESDYPIEKDALESVISQIPANEVDKALKRHLAMFDTGEQRVLDLEGSYGRA